LTTYAIGDIQGCYQPLQQLLKKIEFNPSQDTLWLVGDLVNRGPQSLEVLRFLADLPQTICTLGNHDIHLLGVYFGVRNPHPKDTLEPILEAPDAEKLIHWLRQQKLFHWDKTLGFAMAHAGIYPSWSFEDAQKYSEEISQALQTNNLNQLKLFLSQIFGDDPKQFSPDLTGWDRARCIINCFTRMRVCTPDSELIFDYKGTYQDRPVHTEAWFNQRIWDPREKLIFGHWAALMGQTQHPNLFGIDTGCIWGNQLTALKLPDTPDQHPQRIWV
jgi:bis(5'-nucleosyl)-tetraphosphatase (symmetrical)